MIHESPPRRSLEDDVDTEWSVHFTDDDMDESIFRALIMDYLTYCAGRPRPRACVVFSLMNYHMTAHASTVAGRLECATREEPAVHRGKSVSGSAPAIFMNIQAPGTGALTQKRTVKEYYIDGRLHRSGSSPGSALPAVERSTMTELQDSRLYVESNVDTEFWQHGQPLPGPLPFSVHYDSVVVSVHSDGGIQETINALDVRWSPQYSDDKIPPHPLRLTAERVQTVHNTRHINAFTHDPDHADVTERLIQGLNLTWPVRPGLVSIIKHKEFFEQLCISPKHIDWDGERFFLRNQDELAFMAHLTGGYSEWISPKN